MPKELVAILSKRPVLRDYEEKPLGEDTVFRLMRDKKLTAEGMITPIYPFERSVEAYRFIDEHPDRCIKN